VVLMAIGRLVFAGTPQTKQTPQTPRTPAAPTTAQAPATPAPPAPPAPGVAAPAAPAAPSVPGPPRREGQPINVKVELTISEEGGGTPPLKKTVSTVVGDSSSGSVREQATAPGSGPIWLNFDVYPVIMASGKIRLQCSVQYTTNSSTAPGDRAAASKTEIRESWVTILENGKPLTISQATDPISDRRTTVEVNATILK